MTAFPCQPTNYGFRWGPCEITRVASNPTWGCALDIETPKALLQLRITPKGLIRVGSVYKKGKARK